MAENIIFTNECKSNIIAKTGVNFTLKGYCLYSKDLGDDLEDLTINDLKKDYLSEIFNVTYIPSLETTIIDDTNKNNAKLGIYEIPMNEALYTDDFKSSDKKYIVLIGILLNEEKEYTEVYNEKYLAAIIDVSEFDLNKPQKFILQISLIPTKEVEVYNVEYDSDFEDFAEATVDYDSNTIEYTSKLTLIPQDFYPVEEGKSLKANLVLLDDSDKVSNNWNKNSNIFIGLNRTSEVNVPHIQLSNNYNGIDSISFTYNPNENYFGINNDYGIILTNILSYDNISHQNSNSAMYIKSNGITSTNQNTFNLNTNRSELNGDFITSINNTDLMTYISDDSDDSENLFLDTNNSYFKDLLSGTCINCDNINEQNSFDTISAEYCLHTFLNASNIIPLENPLETLNVNQSDSNSATDFNYNSNNIIFIGPNNKSTYTPNKLLSKLYKNYWIPSSNDYYFDSISSNVIQNHTLIGFNGLTVTQLPSNVYWSVNDSVSSVQNTNGSVVFGSYNSDFNQHTKNDSKFSYCAIKGDESQIGTWGHHIHFNNVNDERHSKEVTYYTTSFSYDEGDLSHNKIFVVANGKQYTSKNVITGHSPAEFASYTTKYAEDGYRLNTFSVEKDSWQLSHIFSPDNTSLEKTTAMYIPGMFAVRNVEPVRQKYSYINEILFKLPNKYILQNAIYTPSSILVPLRRSSNDGYEVPLTVLSNATRPNVSDFSQLKNACDNLKPTIFTLYCSDLNLSIITLDDIIAKIDDYNSTEQYTIYLINDTLESKTFNYNSTRYKMVSTYTIEIGNCKKIIFTGDKINYIKY